MLSDVRGLPLTGENPNAVETFDATINEFLASGRDTGPLLQSLDEADPTLLMGVCLRGYLMKMANLEEWNEKSFDSLERAKDLSTHATKREQLHVDALEAWCAGNLKKTVRIWDHILIEYPHDILALRLSHNMHFFLGDIWRMRDSLARVLPNWDEGVDGYGFVLGCRCFALEEAGQYEEAEPIGRRAIDINENDIWAGHAVAHVLEMQGRRREGIDWITKYQEPWRKRGVFSKHLWWHRALHYLEFNDVDAVMNSFDTEFWPEPSEDNIDICNSSSMLMRLEILGVNVKTRWETIAEIATQRTKARLRPFDDLHFLMTLVMSERFVEADELLSSMQDFVANSDKEEVTLNGIYEVAAIPVGQSLISYAKGDYDTVVDIMTEARYSMRVLGGSWAQRDVWVRMLIDSAIKSGRTKVAIGLLAERLAAQPSSGPSWQLYSKELGKVGATLEAEKARLEGEGLLAQ